jgi:hypothetical protein
MRKNPTRRLPRQFANPSPEGSPQASRAARARAQHLAEDLRSALPSLFSTTALARLPGLAGKIGDLLAPVRSVELVPLDDEDKVRIVGDRLLIDPTYLDQLGALKKGRQARERFFLYVAHEVAHLFQGVGAKSRVRELHAADGEETLLQVDLEADHAAAVFVNGLTGIDLITLKWTGLEMLEAFPANVLHFPGAVQRKARRTVGVSADIAARNRGLLVGAGSFAHLHWTRGGGPALLFLRGEHMQLAATFSVNSRDASLFDSAATLPRRSRKIVAALERLIESTRVGEGR